MATVQPSPEVVANQLTASEGVEPRADILSLTMAALRLVAPWTPETARGDRIFTLADVAMHDTLDDCWVVIYDRVYDITKLIDDHPGGADVLLENAGRDASIPFRGSGHSRAAMLALERYRVGDLPLSERLYRRPTGGVRFSGLPD